MKRAFFFKRQATFHLLNSPKPIFPMKSLITLIFTLTLSFAPASSLASDEVFARLQSIIKTDEGLDDLLEDLEELDNKELTAILKQFDRTWPRVRDKYLKDYQSFLKSKFTGSSKNDSTKKIRKYRSKFMEVYKLEESPMSPLLKETSMPAIEALKKLIIPSFDLVFETAPAPLIKQRKIVIILAKFRDTIVETAVLNDQEPVEKAIIASEQEIITTYGKLPRSGLRIMKKNDKIAEKEEIPDDERKGIRQLNEWRLLLGLNALIIDHKLCNASRTHSEDMNKGGFFAHNSPVPGRETPSDRAAEAGTSTTGENIFMGSPSPDSANNGWFYSSGHHKNMFNPGHRRIGLGRYKHHWTQLFG